MSNLSEFPTGRELLQELGGIYALEEHIGIHTILATERGFGGNLADIPQQTAGLPGVCFRFRKSDCFNYCKLSLSPSGVVHMEFRNLPDGQLIAFESVKREVLKEAFSNVINATDWSVASYI